MEGLTLKMNNSFTWAKWNLKIPSKVKIQIKEINKMEYL
jgi:hypothetical protein